MAYLCYILEYQISRNNALCVCHKGCDHMRNLEALPQQCKQVLVTEVQGNGQTVPV